MSDFLPPVNTTTATAADSNTTSSQTAAGSSGGQLQDSSGVKSDSGVTTLQAATAAAAGGEADRGAGDKASITSSITGGTSRFLGKVWDKKNGLMDGISSKLDSVSSSVSSYLPKRPSTDEDAMAGRGGDADSAQFKNSLPGDQEQQAAAGSRGDVPKTRRRPPRNRSDSEDSSEPEYDDGSRNLERLTLGDSDPDNIDDRDLDDYGRECRDYMKTFVALVFANSADIDQEMKSKFGEYCQSESGRMWFARQVNAMRVNSQKVSEASFFSLVQYFAVVLLESNNDEDFSPAKILMNMCFTFYHEVQPKLGFLGKAHKVFLYSYLKDQQIWQSLRFWNAAFFDAVQKERYKPTTTREQWDTSSTVEKRDERSLQENIVFGQLGTFTCNMMSFGLSKELCLEFLRKQSTIANLKQEQIEMLKDNIQRGQVAAGDAKTDMSWMPNLPELPSMPSMPTMPSMPSMPKPSMPSMPHIPNPVSRLFHKSNDKSEETTADSAAASSSTAVDNVDIK